MSDPERFEYTPVTAQAGEAGFLPQLPLILTYKNQSVNASGLLDTGATVNVLPYRVGLQLGAEWDPQAPAITLTGNLAQFPARPIVVLASVGRFPSTRSAFAWTQAEDIPLILGQVNFFMEFDVCFYRSQRAFDVRPKS
jgi:hypothetical protein